MTGGDCAEGALLKGLDPRSIDQGGVRPMDLRTVPVTRAGLFDCEAGVRLLPIWLTGHLGEAVVGDAYVLLRLAVTSNRAFSLSLPTPESKLAAH